MNRKKKPSAKLSNSSVDRDDGVPDKDIRCVRLSGVGQVFIPHSTRIRKPTDSVEVISKVTMLIHLAVQNLMITRHFPMLSHETVVDLMSPRRGDAKTVLKRLLTSPG